MSFFMMTGLTRTVYVDGEALRLEEFCGVAREGTFVFPGTTWDEQIDSALEFVDAIDAGMGDAIAWIEANLTQFAGDPEWAENVFASFFDGVEQIFVNSVLEVDLAGMLERREITAGAESIADVIEADESEAFTQVLATAVEALAVA